MSDTPARLRFVPWVRAGAAQAIVSADGLAGALAANATLEPWIRIGDHEPIDQTVTLRGPGHVAALAAHAVAKVEPRDGTTDFEPNYFPFAELRTADLPWRFTPASSGDRNQLRPWLVLVVVRQQDGVSVVTEAEAPLPVLRIESPAKASLELPDLSDSASWAHVQTAVAPDALADALERDPTAALARLVCPRRLEPEASWIACLVPAFDVGVHAGLGEAGATATEARLAWDHSDTVTPMDDRVVRLPVYYRWTFATGPSGDFESLARRLSPDEAGRQLGRIDLDVTNPGPPLPNPPRGPRVIADYVGALRSADVERRALSSAYTEWFERELEKLLERGASRRVVKAEAPHDYVPERDDPVVAPPLYGSFQTGRYDVPDARLDSNGRPWMRPLNMSPDLRAIAGLGAAVVRANQESLMASAWTQAAEIREAQRALDQGRLAIEVGRSAARHARVWAPGAFLQATARLHAWVVSPASGNPLTADLHRTAIPPGLVSAPFARAARPRSAVGRRWPPGRANRSNRRQPLSSATETFLAATSTSADETIRVALDFAATRLPVGAWTHDAALEAAATIVLSPTARRPLRAAQSTPAHRRLIAYADMQGPISGVHFDATYSGAVKLENELRDVLTLHGVQPEPLRQTLDLSGAASAVVTQVDPLAAVKASLVSRIPALAGLVVNADALPSRIAMQPVFTDALSWDLVRLDARYALPGADDIGRNRVALLEADADFVAAFLCGANHEMSRELLWREFPTSLGHTFFHRFWDTGDGGSDDTGDISGWRKPRLGENLSGVSSGSLTVILLRADLVRRYPDAHIYLTRGVWRKNQVTPDPGQISEPVLQGALDRDTFFYGFTLSDDEMRGSRRARPATKPSPESAGWFITIEEPSHGPRFGLDAPAEDGSDLESGAGDWRALSWGHLVPRGGTIADIRFAVGRTALPRRTKATIGDLSWGHNAAHMAAITWQVPFRLFIHADRLLPPKRTNSRITVQKSEGRQG